VNDYQAEHFNIIGSSSFLTQIKYIRSSSK